MLGNFSSLAASTAILLVTSSAVFAEPVYTLNRQQTEAIALANLSPGGDCSSDELAGRVLAVEHNRRGTLPVAFTIEHRDGTRTYINIDEHEFANASRLAQGWVADGLQRMVRKGKHVAVGARLCGAAGRVIMLDSIRTR